MCVLKIILPGLFNLLLFSFLCIIDYIYINEFQLLVFYFSITFFYFKAYINNNATFQS